MLGNKVEDNLGVVTCQNMWLCDQGVSNVLFL